MKIISPVERAFELAKTGHYESFSQVKKALRRQFDVERQLVGRQLAADVTRICRESRQTLLDSVKEGDR